VTGIDASSASLAQLQQLLALTSLLSGRSATTAASGVDFTKVLQTVATGSSSSSASGGITGADVVADARKYLGVPYVLGGTTTKGIDCSGLVQSVFKDLGKTDVARGVHGQMTQGEPVASLADAKPGDLIVFKGGGHIAIYAGDNTVIHAPYPGRTVSEQKLWTDDSGIETIRRMVPSGDAATSASGAAGGVLGSLTGIGTDASSTQGAFLLGLALGQGSALGGLSGLGGSSGLSGLGTSTSSSTGIDPTLLAQLITAQSALAARTDTGSDS
jgi:peptidoglycan DL-endopeptidase CwlO